MNPQVKISNFAAQKSRNKELSSKIFYFFLKNPSPKSIIDVYPEVGYLRYCSISIKPKNSSQKSRYTLCFHILVPFSGERVTREETIQRSQYNTYAGQYHVVKCDVTNIFTKFKPPYCSLKTTHSPINLSLSSMYSIKMQSFYRFPLNKLFLEVSE